MDISRKSVITWPLSVYLVWQIVSL